MRVSIYQGVVVAIAEEIQDLNKRISSLEKKQEEVKRTLAVEEHKLSELEAQLKEEGYDVSKMSDEQIEALMDKLSEEISTEMERLKGIIAEAEKQYEKFQELR
jgi:predicted  nucleic acid-binding Zn-ribbon protein